MIFRAKTSQASLALPKGYEVAWDQIKLPIFKKAELIDISKFPELKLKDDKTSIQINGTDFTLQFD